MKAMGVDVAAKIGVHFIIVRQQILQIWSESSFIRRETAAVYSAAKNLGYPDTQRLSIFRLILCVDSTPLRYISSLLLARARG